jgi:putative transposase
MYARKRMSEMEIEGLLAYRQRNGLPWHYPPRYDQGARHYMITAACYSHVPVLAIKQARMFELERCLAELVLEGSGSLMRAWVVLPNDYHILVFAPSILVLLEALGKMHGRLSRQWNLEDATVGRKVWHGAVETLVKSDRHHHAVLNYIHHNPVKHGYVERWQDWPLSSAHDYLKSVGLEEATRRWKEYPIDDFGQGWDDPDL